MSNVNILHAFWLDMRFHRGSGKLTVANILSNKKSTIELYQHIWYQWKATGTCLHMDVTYVVFDHWQMHKIAIGLF